MLHVIGGNDVDAADHNMSGVAKLVYAKLVDQLLFADGRRERGGSGATQRHFRTPPHCFGYNWTRPIEDSADALREFVTALKSKYRRHGGRCDRVVLVTHSTGGLVARWACKRADFRADVLGVIHAGVPHRGAPEMYYRFKTGFPRGKVIDTVVAWITARSGDEGTALLGSIPGAIPLLPFGSYRTSDGAAHWLAVERNEGPEIQRPTTSPYADIYLQRAVWGLVDAHDLDPRRRVDPEQRYRDYRAIVEATDAFHRDIEAAGHPNSVNLVSVGVPTAERIALHATNDPVVVERLRRRGGRDDTLDRGEFRAVGRLDDGDETQWAVELQPRTGDGDATVPTVSATQPGVRTVFVEGVAHADLLNDRKTHALVIDEIERMLRAAIDAAMALTGTRGTVGSAP